jgi:hypothetical protein
VDDAEDVEYGGRTEAVEVSRGSAVGNGVGAGVVAGVEVEI